jgi:hypothetical protein
LCLGSKGTAEKSILALQLLLIGRSCRSICGELGFGMSSTLTQPRARLRLLALLVLLLAAAGLLFLQRERLGGSAVLKVEDFGAYWSAARLTLEDRNPNDLDNLRPLQQGIDPTREDILPPWSPPWTLAFVVPFAAVNFAAARWTWLILEAALTAACAAWVWQLYGGQPEKRWVAWLVAFTFYPALQLLGLGQLSIIGVVGLLGFLHCERRGQDFLAGLFAGLAATKPQVLLLFWVALLAWSIVRRRWAVPLGAALTVSVLTGIVVAFHPTILLEYADALAHHPPAERVCPTLGTVLRYALGGEHFGLSFIGPLLGLVWLIGYGWRYRVDWEWRERLPVLLFVCYLTMPYGWVYDQVILLIPLIQVLTRVTVLSRRVVVPMAVLWFALNASTAIMNVLRVDEVGFLWFAPLLLLGYLSASKLLRNTTMLSPAE